MNTIGARPTQVFVVAPAMLSWGLERLLETARPHLELAGTAVTLAHAQAALLRCVADVILVDFDGGYGIEALQELSPPPGARLMVLTSSQDVQMLDRAVVAGVRGIVRKSDPPAALLKAIEKVQEGELWIDRGAAGRIFMEVARQNAAQANDPDRLKISSLTMRERQAILAVTGDAASPCKVIADRLCISEHTLRNHLSTIYAKLGLQNRLDLYAYASKHQLNKAG
jgi:DNA-binding NarL/FixJ family response regulator